MHPGADKLTYEIRGIVEFAKQIETTGINIVWENIGDPIAKGEKVPTWIKKIVANEIRDNDLSYGYSPTKGLDLTRDYLAKARTAETGKTLNPENIIFFNGLGDAITEIYTWLSPYARVLGPSPAYPTHSSLEGAHARSGHLAYHLDPKNNWIPDINDIRDRVHYDSDVAGLLIINPDNPTGTVHSRTVLEQIVSIAKEYGLFIIADEIYANLAYEKNNFVSLAELAGEVPTMIMRGLSKEVPWPGSRCGWVEFYNTSADPSFARYAKSIEDAKMNEVCATTLPQAVLPKILSDKRYESHLQTRRTKYQARAEVATQILGKNKNIQVVKPQGAFYLSVIFDKEYMQLPEQEAANTAAQGILATALSKIPEKDFDKRFCYHLLAATGICTVPLQAGFNSHVQGFRITLLEEDEKEFTRIVQVISDFIY